MAARYPHTTIEDHSCPPVTSFYRFAAAFPNQSGPEQRQCSAVAARLLPAEYNNESLLKDFLRKDSLTHFENEQQQLGQKLQFQESDKKIQPQKI